MDEESKDLVFQLAQSRIDLEAAQKVIAAARSVVNAETDRLDQAITELRAAIALYDVLRTKAAEE
jgi:hypothetical protein